MSKTWTVPADSILRIESIKPGGSTVTVGEVVGEWQMLSFQGASGDGMPTVDTKAPASGRLLLFPGMKVGAKIEAGTKVFSVLSDEDWKELGNAAGEVARARMAEPEPEMALEEFEAHMQAMNDSLARQFMRKLTGR